jgi:hypothetical protein
MTKHVAETRHDKVYVWRCPSCKKTYKQRVSGVSQDVYFALIRELKDGRRQLSLLDAKRCVDLLCANLKGGRKHKYADDRRATILKNVPEADQWHVLAAWEHYNKIIKERNHGTTER